MRKFKSFLLSGVVMAGVMIGMVINQQQTVFGFSAQNVESCAKQLREGMVARKSKVTLQVTDVYEDELGAKIYDKAIAYTTTAEADEGDYLKEHISSYKVNIQRVTPAGSDISTITFTYEMTYRSTAQQEQKVTGKVASIIKELNVSNKSDYAKIKAVHDYVAGNVAYDYSYQNYSAYNAALDKTSVCQGYALLTYRLLTELGIQTRCISGKSYGENHMWNIVKCDGKWYNLDVTWDSQTNGKVVYDYFMKNNLDFYGHVRDAEYKKSSFKKAYPIASDSYGKTTVELSYFENTSGAGFYTVDDKKVGSSDLKKQISVIMFFSMKSDYAKNQLLSFAKTEMVTSGNVKVYAIEADSASNTEVKKFAKKNKINSNVIMGYNKNNTAFNLLWKYVKNAGDKSKSIQFPVTVILDKQKNIRFYQSNFVPTSRLNTICEAIRTEVKAKKVILNKKKVKLKKGQKFTLKATIKPAKCKMTVTYKSANQKVAKVTKKGVIKAIKKGKTKITVKTPNGKKAVCTVIVR